MTDFRPMYTTDEPALQTFLRSLPRRDGGFLKVDVDDSTEMHALLGRRGGARIVAVAADEEVVGFAAVQPSSGRSSHVADLRLVVAADARRHGIGRGLALVAMISALELGLEKLVVEVVSDQDDLVEMFLRLGFEAEALLHDFVRDENGTYSDLIVLVHPAMGAAADILSVGIDLDRHRS